MLNNKGSYYEQSKGISAHSDQHEHIIHQKDTEAQKRLRKETRARKKRFEARERAIKLKEERRRLAILEERKKKVSAHRNDIELAKGHKYDRYKLNKNGTSSRRSSFSASQKSTPKHFQYKNSSQASSNSSKIPTYALNRHNYNSNSSDLYADRLTNSDKIVVKNQKKHSHSIHNDMDSDIKNVPATNMDDKIINISKSRSKNITTNIKPHDELFHALDESLDEFINQYYETEDVSNNKKSETYFSMSPTASSSSTSIEILSDMKNDQRARKDAMSSPKQKKNTIDSAVTSVTNNNISNNYNDYNNNNNNNSNSTNNNNSSNSTNNDNSSNNNNNNSSNNNNNNNSRIKNYKDKYIIDGTKQEDIDDILSQLQKPSPSTSSFKYSRPSSRHSQKEIMKKHLVKQKQQNDPSMPPLAPLKDTSRRMIRRSSRPSSRNSILSQCSVFGCEEKAESRRYCAHHLQTCFPPALSNSSIATTVSRSSPMRETRTTRSTFSVASLPPLNIRQPRENSLEQQRQQDQNRIQYRTNKNTIKTPKKVIDKSIRQLSAPVIKHHDHNTSKIPVYNDYPSRGYAPRARARSLRIQQRKREDNVVAKDSTNMYNDRNTSELTVPDIRLDESYEEERLKQSIDRLENRLATLIKRSSNRQARLNIIENMKNTIPAPTLPTELSSNERIVRKNTGVTNRNSNVETSHDQFPPFIFS